MIDLTSLFTFISLLDIAFAFSVPFSRSDTPSSTSINFTNADGFAYLVTVEFDGQPVQVQLDTGSSDLWIDSPGINLTPFANTGRNGTILYGPDGHRTVAGGPILVGPVQFGDFKVDKQAFISAPGSNATQPSLNQLGILGVAPTTGSQVAHTLKNTSYNGRTFLDNAFMMYPEEPNYITFMLSRDPVYGTTSGGTFTIGEVATEFAAITNTPQRKVLSTTSFPRWATTMDGIIVNGKTYSGHSKFNSTFVSAGQTIALLDSGTSYALAPRFYADAIFKDVPGAVFNMTQSMYTVPCDTKVNVSFVFGKDEYPVNPIDIVSVTHVSNSGDLTCSGLFLVADAGDLDIILGDTFLRNAYALFDFGRWATPGTSDPFVQLLSTTNQAQAWNDFDAANAVRLDSFKKLSKGSSGGNTTKDDVIPSPASPESSDSDLLRNSYIIIGLLVGVIVLLLVLFALVARGSKNVGYKPLPNVSRAGPGILDDEGYEKSYTDSAP
ncbi:hypothetical protein JAAARDRAFT_36005 [Jaapia argillacea MUCL 33604]|uniref:Peptidase A1 domain-containing protein n=1 Tax=Jaapia argillacea MUCL 33604 TaxID=933084 RepID=A0A067PRD2_9AGAM|nr:hypothetical protein JAAARDRAFT_36005 [Jaapia argillacea MUCL 33604]